MVAVGAPDLPALQRAAVALLLSPSAFVGTLYHRPWLLLSLCALFWAGNAVAGRLAVDAISPMSLTFLRWAGAALILAALIPQQLRANWTNASQHWPYLLGMGALGFTGFNAFLYFGAHHTNGVNLLVIQGAIPIMIMGGGALLFAQRVSLLQGAGFALTMLGVLVTAVQGDVARLAGLSLNSGDVFVLLAGVTYAGYALALRYKPALPGLTLFFWFVVGAVLSSALGLLMEIAVGTAFWPTPKGWLLVAYCVVFPSIASQLFFIRGVELIGPSRAGLCVNLIPVFGSILMVLAGEPFLASHGLALALVLGGVAIAESGKPQALAAGLQTPQEDRP